MYQADKKRYEGMNYNRCGKSGLKLPEVSLGLWHNFGDTGNFENMKRMCFIKSEVEGEIYAMKEKISTNKILASTSLVFGILSLFSFVLYFYSANHAPYTYIDVIFWGPLCSFIGIVISIITRKTRKIYPALWISGIISCMLGFIVCMFAFSVLIMLMAAK